MKKEISMKINTSTGVDSYIEMLKNDTYNYEKTDRGLRHKHITTREEYFNRAKNNIQ